MNKIELVLRKILTKESMNEIETIATKFPEVASEVGWKESKIIQENTGAPGVSDGMRKVKNAALYANTHNFQNTLDEEGLFGIRTDGTNLRID